jgi:hypothetical protein
MKPHVLDEDDIKYLQKEENTEKNQKKNSKAILIFLIILISLFGFIHFLGNFITSEKIYDKSINFPEKKIIFSNKAIQKLQNEYIENQHREIKACLYGKRAGREVYIDDVDFPKIISASVISIESYSCPIDAIGDIHSHPIKSCIASEQDIKVLKERKKIDEEYIMLIMCGKDRFSIVK